MRWLDLGLRLVPLIGSAVNSVERMCPAASGKEKQDAAIAALGAMLHTVESPACAALFRDPHVDDATRKLIDCYVAWQNIVAAAAQRSA